MHLHFCLSGYIFAPMKEKTLTPLEAWADFEAYILTLPDFRITNEIATARRDKEGARKDRYGRPIWLGPKRIERLLSKYAPGRYTFRYHVTVTLNDCQ